MKNIFTLTLFLVFASNIVANTSELDKFNNTKSTISFKENKGQVSDQNYNPRTDVLFSGVANGLQFHIRNNGVSYQNSRVDSWKQKDENLPEGMSKEGITDSLPDQMTIYRTDINWLGFNKDYTIETGASTAGFNNYYLPSCPDGAMNVRSYLDVTFKNLYAGIDVKWYEKNGELEYDFIVAPNADYTKISWEIKGADRISIGKNGQLIIETPLGNIEEQAPIAFQGEEQVKATWKIEGNKISFQLGSYNENEVLIIDPVVRQWGTYYGGTGDDRGNSCAIDASGNIYLAGWTSSTTGIATTGAHQTTFGGFNDAFLVKFNSSGVRQWGTYYGGTDSDYSNSCATDTSGNIYCSGVTKSTGIATTGTHKTTYGGGSNDAFLVKFNSSGVRQWGTYYGGTGTDYGNSCAIDASGNIYLSGYTYSTSGIATTGAHKNTYGGGSNDAFLVKFNSSGVRQWGTYYGGTGGEEGNSCATDTSGNIYLSGYTQSTSGIATTGAHKTTYGGGNTDAFLVKFNSSGVRQWGTYYGGTDWEEGSSCATDASGNIYLSGTTFSASGIATTGAHQDTIGVSNDAFLVKFNSSGVRQWGTYYGGAGTDRSYSCATDISGNIYFSGLTGSNFGIVTTGAHQTTRRNFDVFLVKFNSSGVRQWGTYYGGTGWEEGWSCATDSSGNIYLAGQTGSTSGIATTGAHQTTFGGNYDAFLVKFHDCKTSYSQTINACDSYTWINGVTYTASNSSAKDTLTNAAGCDSIVTLNLTITNSNTGTAIVTACDSYTWIDGVTYTASNNSAVDTLINASGCDSVVTLNLTITNSTTGTDVQTACNSFTWSQTGVTYTTSGTYKDTVTNTVGCDSIISLNLTVNYPNTGTDIQTACNSFTWSQTGVTYTTSGTYKDTVTNTVGCDSIISLNLTVNYPNTGIDIQTACNSYTWIDGVTYTASNNTVTHTLTNAAGCDSVVTLNLTLNTSTTGTDVQTACNSYTWINGVTYTGSNNTATDTLTNASGCDSIVTLNLTINPTVVITSQPANEMVFVGGNAQFQVTASGTGLTYQWQINSGAGFSNISSFGIYSGATTNTLNISNVPPSIQQNGFRCLINDVNGCSDSTNAGILYISLTGLGEENLKNNFIIYPNPVNSLFIIETTITYTSGKVLNSLGQSVLEFNNETTLDVSNLKAGNYILLIKGEHNEVLKTEKFNKY